MATSPLKLLNRLLPFATPNTPLLQDLIHLAALCLVLYFAPQIQQRLQNHGNASNDTRAGDAGHQDAPEVQNDQHPPHQNNEPEVNGPQQNRRPENEPLGDEPQPNDFIPEGQPGPANAANIAQQRNVGTKKAKSLARRDQRRAYHEFMRSQGDAQRARDAEGAAEREAALAAEKDRRKAAEAALDAKKASEREKRRQREEQERMEEFRRRDLAVSMVREDLDGSGMCDLFKIAERVGGEVDDEWVERMLNAAGVLGRKADIMTMVTSTGWAVRVTKDDMARLYINAAENGMGDVAGRIEMEELGAVLESFLRA